MNTLEASLEEHIANFGRERDQKLVGFTTLNGESCLRVALVGARDVFEDKGYDPERYGQHSQGALRTEVVKSLKERDVRYLGHNVIGQIRRACLPRIYSKTQYSEY